jgi:tetratricopeptide (TPR) repeat protein
MRLFWSLFLLALPLAACFSTLDPEAREAAKKRTQLTQTIESGTLANERLADAYVQRGNAWRTSHDPENALADYSRAVEVAPSLATGYEARAQLLLSLRRYDPALDDASKLVTLGPASELNGRLIRAAVLAATGRHDLAAAEYDEVIARFGRSWQMLARRGAELVAIGVQGSRYEQALADLERAGTFGDNLVYRGLAKLGLGRCSDGYDDLRHSTGDTQIDLKSTLAAHQAFIQQTKCAGYAP